MNLEPSHIYHFKGRVARCSTFTGEGTDNQGSRIAFGSPTTDYGVIRYEAERFLAELRERFAHFSLQLHADKTRSVEFGRFAEQNRRQRGEGKPVTFNFLGLTHICGRTRKGHFTVLRQTMRQRQQAKLRALKEELRRRMHTPIGEQGAYLRSGPNRTLPLLWSAVERSGPDLVSGGSRPLVVEDLATPQPEAVAVAPSATPYPTLVSPGSYLSSLSAGAPRRSHLRWEPDALAAHVRLCGGGRE
jgi:RNA-directed DNA polymerase